MSRRRPFRATAFVPDPVGSTGRRRTVAGRVAACSREGLDRFVDAQLAAGNEVDVIEILDLLDGIVLHDPPRSGTVET